MLVDNKSMLGVIRPLMNIFTQRACSSLMWKPTCAAVGLRQQPSDTCAYSGFRAVIQIQWLDVREHKSLPRGRRVHHSEPVKEIGKCGEAKKKKKTGDKTVRKCSSNHCVSSLLHRAGNTDVAQLFVGKISAPELFPSHLMSFSVRSSKRNPGKNDSLEQPEGRTSRFFKGNRTIPLVFALLHPHCWAATSPYATPPRAPPMTDCQVLHTGVAGSLQHPIGIQLSTTRAGSPPPRVKADSTGRGVVSVLATGASAAAQVSAETEKQTYVTVMGALFNHSCGFIVYWSETEK